MRSWRRANLPRCHSTYPTQLRPYGLLGQWVATGPFMLVRRLSGESAEEAAGKCCCSIKYQHVMADRDAAVAQELDRLMGSVLRPP
jgi:hypothetical protein